jgi:hypothetical protein
MNMAALHCDLDLVRGGFRLELALDLPGGGVTDMGPLREAEYRLADGTPLLALLPAAAPLPPPGTAQRLAPAAGRGVALTDGPHTGGQGTGEWMQ